MDRQFPPAPPAHDDHAWVRRRLAAAAAGLLEADETERFESHLAACASCAEAWREQAEALAHEVADGENHLTAAMVARWEQAARDLRGAEREAVHRHLVRCADCRADLEALGHRPELTASPALAVVGGGRRGRTFGAGLAWGIGVTALAAAVSGLLLLPGPGADTEAVLPWVAPTNLRGGEPAVLELAPGAGAFTVLAAVPAGFDPARAATVTVRDPQGHTLVTAEVTPEMQTLRTVSILVRVRGGVPPGEYQVVFAQPAAAGPPLERSSTFLVDLRRR